MSFKRFKCFCKIFSPPLRQLRRCIPLDTSVRGDTDPILNMIGYTSRESDQEIINRVETYDRHFNFPSEMMAASQLPGRM